MKQSDLFVSLNFKIDIDRLFRKGRYYDSHLFRSRYLLIPRRNTFRLSTLPIDIIWAAPKKMGKAHYRNRLKRVSRSAFFEVLKKIEKKDMEHHDQNLHLVFIPKTLFEKADFSERTEAIKKFLTEIRFIR